MCVYMGCYHSNCDYFFLASLSLFVRGGGFFGVGGFSFCSGQSSFLFTHAFVFAIPTTPKLFPSPRIDHDLVKMLVIQTGTVINTHNKKPQVSAKMILHPSHQYHNTTIQQQQQQQHPPDTLTRYCLRNPRAPSLQTTST